VISQRIIDKELFDARIKYHKIDILSLTQRAR